MDYKTKSEYLDSDQFSKNKDSGLVWDTQKILWESQRQTHFATLLEEEVVDNSVVICSKKTMDDKMNKPTGSNYSNSVAKSNTYIRNDNIGLSLNSPSVDAKSPFQMYVKHQKNLTGNNNPTPYLMNNIDSSVPVNPELMYITQPTAIQSPPWIPIMNTYQHPGLLAYTPFGINSHFPQTVSNNNICVANSEELKTASNNNWHFPQAVSNNNNNIYVENSEDLKTASNNNCNFSQTVSNNNSICVANSEKLKTASNTNCCVAISEDIKSENTPEFTPPTAAIKCYVCDQHVIKSEFALHLLFGALKCNDCQLKVIDCKSFRSDLFIASNCTHKHLSWSENPIEYLKSQLYKTSIADNKKVYHYLKHLKSLEQLLPWKSVFQEYSRLKKLDPYSKTKCEPADCDTNKCEEKMVNTNDGNCDEVLLLESCDPNQMEEAVQVIGLEGHKMFQENYTDVKSESKITEKTPTVKIKQVIQKELYTFHDTNITKSSKTRDIKSEKLLIQGMESNYSNEIIPPGKIDNILKNTTIDQSIKSVVENILLKGKLKKINSVKQITLKQKQVIKSECSNKKTNLNIIDIKSLKRKRKKQKKNVDKNNKHESIEATLPMDSEKTECDDKKTKFNIIDIKPLKKKSNKQKKNINVDKINKHEPIEATLPMDSEIEFLDLPEDGNYLVTCTPIEECPMCYTKLSLYNCKVNIKLLLYTFWCQCGLNIYFVLKTPDNVDHPTKIIENK